MRSVRTTLALAAALLLGACSGGDGTDPNATSIAQLDTCMETGLDGFMGSLGGLSTLLAVANTPESAGSLGVTWTEATPKVFNFSIPADLDGDGTPTGRFEGSATFDRAPDGGILPGDVVQVQWTLTGHPDLSGDGDIRVELAPGGVELWGGVELDNSSQNCSFAFSVAELLPLVVRIPGVWPLTSSLAADLATPDVSGSGSANVRAGENALSALLRFSGSGVDATNISATVRGVTRLLPNRRISFGNGPPPEVTGLNDWKGTWDIDYACANFTGGQFTGREVFEITPLPDGTLSVSFEDLGDGFKDDFIIGKDANGAVGPFDYDTPTDDGGGFTERGTYRLERGQSGALEIRKDSTFGPWKTLNSSNARGTCWITSSSKR